ncbi:DUF885 domain-containing protein [Candidatus Neomarinimicrobiota bacterium]
MKNLFILIIAVLMISCSVNNDKLFEEVANNYIEYFLQSNPEWATDLGDHRYDGQLSNYDISAITADREETYSLLESLKEINENQLSNDNKIDYNILKTHLEYSIFSIDTLQEYSWNPLIYNVGDGIYGLLIREFAPIETRLNSVKERLEKVGEITSQAKLNLINPPIVHIETAILQNKGNISLIKNDLEMFLDGLPSIKEDMENARVSAIKSLEDYGDWLENDLLPRSDGEFRIGDKKWQRKLHYTLSSSFTKNQILESAEKDLIETQAVMYETALPLYRIHFGEPRSIDKNSVIKSVLDKLAEKRPNNETVVDLANISLKSTTEFVRKMNLVTVPDDPVQIMVMPEYQRGVAVAYCSSPGPFEKGAKTFYTISPTPESWPTTRVESFYKEYNNYMLENLTVHEAMPGHYLQLAHNNQYEAPTLIRSIFGSGTFIEGWATYAEQLMVEYGYGGDEIKMQQLKMRLRLIINSIIDQKIHTDGMSEEDAIKLMMTEGFQEEGEAYGKWRRACMSSTQLSTYYIGNMEINDIRNSYESKHGKDFDIKTMHNEILSFGSPPPKYVKELLKL